MRLHAPHTNSPLWNVASVAPSPGHPYSTAEKSFSFAELTALPSTLLLCACWRPGVFLCAPLPPLPDWRSSFPVSLFPFLFLHLFPTLYSRSDLLTIQSRKRHSGPILSYPLLFPLVGITHPGHSQPCYPLPSILCSSLCPCAWLLLLHLAWVPTYLFKEALFSHPG